MFGNSMYGVADKFLGLIRMAMEWFTLMNIIARIEDGYG
jgi:hypothetical protein